MCTLTVSTLNSNITAMWTAGAGRGRTATVEDAVLLSVTLNVVQQYDPCCLRPIQRGTLIAGYKWTSDTKTHTHTWSCNCRSYDKQSFLLGDQFTHTHTHIHTNTHTDTDSHRHPHTHTSYTHTHSQSLSLSLSLSHTHTHTHMCDDHQCPTRHQRRIDRRRRCWAVTSTCHTPWTTHHHRTPAVGLHTHCCHQPVAQRVWVWCLQRRDRGKNGQSSSTHDILTLKPPWKWN